MLRFLAFTTALLCGWPLRAAERHFDFSQAKLNETPPGFRSTLSGEGKPGEWKIVEDELPPTLAPANAKSSVTARRQVLAKRAGDPADEHFPLLVFEGEIFDDFTLTTRFKTVAGAVEQMAGIAFRFQDERNYYVVRASSLGNTFRFYKFVDGIRSAPVGPEIEIPKGVWHELAVECKGNQIHCFLNGKQVIPALTDISFTEGMVGFWTKSDSVCYFADTRIVYTPRETLAIKLVRETMRKYPRLINVNIFARKDEQSELQIIAGNDPADSGKPAGQYEQEVVARDVAYYGKEEGKAIVSLPLHDRNGDAVAAVRVTMKSFPGQTEQNAVVRAKPIIREMERRFRAAKDLTQ
jgi:hypothetical protein